MEQINIKRSNGRTLTFKGQQLAYFREGTDFANVAFVIFKTAKGKYVAKTANWDGWVNPRTNDGTLTVMAEVCDTAEEIREFFTVERDWCGLPAYLPEMAKEAMEEAGLLLPEEV